MRHSDLICETCSDRTTINIQDMKHQTSARRIITASCLGIMALLPCPELFAAITKSVMIKSMPEGAEIRLDGLQTGKKSGDIFLNVRWEDKRNTVEHREFRIELPDYESRTVRISNLDANVKDKTIVREVILEPLTAKGTVSFSTTPKGATINLEGKRVANPPGSTELLFRRGSSKSPWQRQQATISEPDYAEEVKDLDFDQLKREDKVIVNLARIRQIVEVVINSNEADAEIEIDGKPEGKAPKKHSFEFKRDLATGKWNTFLIVVKKAGYRMKVPGASKTGNEQTFTKTLTLEDAERIPKVDAPLELIRFRAVQRVHLDFTEPTPRFLPQLVFSEINERSGVGVALQQVSKFQAGELIETRLWVLPNSTDVAYSAPPEAIMTNQFSEPNSMPPHMMNLSLLTPRGRKPVTTGPFLDIDPCVSPDGKTIYFASNRTRKDRLNLWSVRLDGVQGRSKVTEDPASLYDLEPTISPDGKTLAFTRLTAGQKDRKIWLKPTGGGLETEMGEGENPSWSPDSSKLAYIAKDREGFGKIKIIDLNGNELGVELSLGSGNKRHPCWTPDGQRIVYASDEANNEDGTPTWNIWIVAVNTALAPMNLTSSGSHHERPVVSPDGKFLYFLSSRAAQKAGEPFLQVWRIRLDEALAPETTRPGNAPGGAKP